MKEKQPRLNPQQIADSRRVLEESQQSEFPYNVHISDLDFIVHKGVLSPRHFNSTDIFSRHFPYREGERLLEMGCGLGITGVIAALRGAESVLALDINPQAVENTIANAKLHHVEHILQARVSNLFEAVGEKERFDTIYWNMPFIYVEDHYEYRSMLERSLYDPGYRLARQFLRESKRFLLEGGRLLIGFGDFGDIPSLMAMASEEHYRTAVIAREPGFEGVNVEFILYEFIP